MIETRLQPLRTLVRRIHRRRRRQRLLTAWSAVGTAVLSAGAALWLLDWTLDMDRPQRLLSTSVAVLVVAWVFRRWTRPLLSRREDLTDVALMVERRMALDSDLVAALEFEGPEADGWESRALKDSVIDAVAARTRNAKLGRERPPISLRRRGGILLVTTLVVAALASFYPRHAAVFVNRLLLGGTRYPSRTVIEEVRINDAVVDRRGAGGGARTVAVPFGRKVALRVVASGEAPPRGTARFASETAKGASDVDLLPVGGEAQRSVYSGELPRLVDRATCEVLLGDALSEPIGLEVVPLPVVTVRFEVTAPPYTAQGQGGGRRSPPDGARVVSVAEGSRVALEVRAETSLLERVSVVVDGAEHELEAGSERGDVFHLRPEGTPLERVEKPCRWELCVRDVHGLEPARTVEGTIRVDVDRPPRVVAGVVTRHVLPSATPSMEYRAVDDYGVASIRVLAEVTRKGSPGWQRAAPIALSGGKVERVRSGTHTLRLEPLALVPGDEVRVIVEAVDHRGDRAGKSGSSEPTILEVTDERGILRAMLESDERSARELERIIQRQLGMERRQ